MQVSNWAAAAAVEWAVVGEGGTTVVHSRILAWHMVDAAAGCTGHLMVVVLEREGWHMAEMEGQSSRVHCMGRVLHDAEEGDGGGGVDVADGGSGSS